MVQMVFPLKRAQITHSHTLGNTDSPAPQKSLTVRMEASLVTSLTQFRSSDVTNEVFLKLIFSIGRRRPLIYTENKVPLTWSQLQTSENTGTIASEACSAPHTLDLLQPHPFPFLSLTVLMASNLQLGRAESQCQKGRHQSLRCLSCSLCTVPPECPKPRLLGLVAVALPAGFTDIIFQ